MAITIPTNAETTRYSYQVGQTTGVTFAANAIPSTDIAEGDHFVVFTGHSDNVGTSQSAPSGWTKWFEYINGDGDDFTLYGYYHTVTSGEASGGSASAAFTFGENEEFTAVMFHVEGADDTDFDDQVTPTVTNTQNTDSPIPAAITTNTDGAVVIVLDANQSDAGHLNQSSDRSGYFQPIGPAGYTIEDGGYTSGTNAEGAPGRLEMGTGFADAQMSWGWKTVATAGTETPGNWSQSGGNGSEYINLRDHKTVTMVIKPATSGTGHTETPTNAVGVTDSTARIVDYKRTVTDAVGVTDSTTRVHDAARVVTDDVGVADDTTDTVSSAGFVAETELVGVTDTVARTHDAVRSVADPAGVTDSVVTVGAIVVTITDGVGATDSTSRISDFVRVVTEPVGVTDVVDSSVSVSAVNIVEAMGVTDSTSIVESSSSVASWGMIPIGI